MCYGNCGFGKIHKMLRLKNRLNDPLNTRLEFLDGFRFLGIIMVIGFHANAYVTLPAGHRSALLFIMSTIAVPVFFLTDGFLFARKQNSTVQFSYASYIQKSTRRLLLPWFLFSSIYLVARYCFEFTGFLEQRIVIGQSAAAVLTKVYTSTIAPQMYFLPSLFLIRMCSPINRIIACAARHIALLVFCFYAFAFRLVDIRDFFLKGQDPILHALWGFQFYLFGVLLFKYRETIQSHSGVIAMTCAGITVLAKLYAPFNWSGLSQYGYLTAAFISFFVWFNTNNLFSRYGRFTMGIYLMHTPILMKGLQVGVHMLGFSRLPAYVLIVGSNLVISIGLTRLITLVPFGQMLLGEGLNRFERRFLKRV